MDDKNFLDDRALSESRWNREISVSRSYDDNDRVGDPVKAGIGVVVTRADLIGIHLEFGKYLETDHSEM